MILEGKNVRIPGFEEFYAAGIISTIAMSGSNSMRGKILVMTTDPSQLPGFSRLLDTQWFDPADVTYSCDFEECRGEHPTPENFCPARRRYFGVTNASDSAGYIL